jgi:hypothetical protein
MNLYEVCSDFIVNNDVCPLILDKFDPKDKGSYILKKINTRNITEDERKYLEEKGYKIYPTVGYVHKYQAYDLDSIKTHLIDNNGNDPLTRNPPSQNILKKIKFKYDNRKYIKSTYDKDKLFNIFCIYYCNKMFVYFSEKINSIIKNYLINDDDINEMRCNLIPTDFNCFINCDRQKSNEILTKNNKTWLLRPSNVDSFNFYMNGNNLVPCSVYYVLSVNVKNKVSHYLIEHFFGEGYYFCSGGYNKEGKPNINRNKWFGSFVNALEHFIPNLDILNFQKN